MNKMKKNLFSDPYAFVRSSEVREPQEITRAATESSSVESTWVDKRTGAEYLLKDHKPQGPQGDFRVPKDVAEERYRAVMGISAVHFGPRPVENPFEEDRLKPEAAPRYRDVEDTVRERISFDTKKQLSFQQTTETAPWAASEAEEHQDYTIDHQGRVRDKPANREGPFGRINEIQEPLRPKFGDQPESVIKQSVGRPVQPVSKHVKETIDLEERLEKRRGLQVLLTSAFRGLFGSQVADHIITRSLSDNKQTFDRPVLSRTIMDAGLMKPWMPHAEATGDRRIRPDMTAMEVGNRALRTLMKGPLAPEIQDLPKAERDDVALAMGRTILNAVMPSKTNAKPDLEQSLKRDLSKSISLSISPAMVAGLLPSDLLDVNVKPQVQQMRTTNASAKVNEIQERAPIAEKQLRENIGPLKAPSANTILNFSKKKNLWTVDDEQAEEVIDRRPRVLFHENSYSA